MLPIDRITTYCFEASYALALLLEILQLWRPRPLQRLLATIAGSAGLLAHSLYLIAQHPSLRMQSSAFLSLAWVLAVFYLYGAMHHRRVAWGLFVLPIILALSILGSAFIAPAVEESSGSSAGPFDLRELWRYVHISVFLLAAVGVSVAFVASVMYLVQVHRLKSKTLPVGGVRLLSLERLETMTRRAINLAFPLLTIGLIAGAVQMIDDRSTLQGWLDPRILTTSMLWSVFAIMLYLRHAHRSRGKRVAVFTILAFGLLMLAMVVPHHLGGNGP